MPWDCGLLCLFTERRRHIEVLWRRRLLITDDERKAKRRFLNLMRGFDTEDLDVLRKAVESRGINIKQCAPGPPMDLIEERDESTSSEEELEPEMEPGCSTTIVSTRPRHSIKQMERDRVLFQQKRKVSTVASIQHQRGGSTIITQQIEPFVNYQRRYTTNKARNSICSNRRYTVYTNDENSNTLRSAATIIRGKNSARSTSSSEGDIDNFEQPKTAIKSDSIDVRPAQRDTSNADAGLIPQIDKPMSMPYLCCKMWRWKDLQVDAALHRLDPLPWCRFGRVTINNATVSCCNPYHYGLWIKPDSSSSDNQSINSVILANGSGNATAEVMFGDSAIGHVRSTFQHSLQAKTKVVYEKNDQHCDESPPMTPPPAPPIGNYEAHTGNHLATTMGGINRRISHSVHHQVLSWGRLARWNFNERIGDMVSLIGQFVVVGLLAGTVFDGQDIRNNWDLDNFTSFALIRRSSDETSENFDEVWLYNSSDQPLFMSVSRNISRSTSSESQNIRRLSPGYCIRVHRIIGLTPSTQNAGDMSNDITHHGDSAITMVPISLLTISIGSGWGVNYDQKSINDLPCRYEVIFT